MSIVANHIKGKAARQDFVNILLKSIEVITSTIEELPQYLTS